MKLMLTILLLAVTFPVSAQEIDFGTYGNYTISLDILEDLDFGSLSRGSSPEDITVYQVELTEALEVEIIGVPFLDVQVAILVENDGYLLLNGDPGCIGDPACSIPFTLEAAFSNAGSENHSPGTAQPIAVIDNVASTRFPILMRQYQPPEPPPPPPTESNESTITMDTAVIYLYGSLEVANVDAGRYSGQILIEVNYE